MEIRSSFSSRNRFCHVCGGAGSFRSQVCLRRDVLLPGRNAKHLTGKTTTPIANPEGESRVSQTISLLVRLDVVGVSQEAPGAAQVRFRATYEKSSAQSESDAFNPDEPSLEDQYARLRGIRSSLHCSRMAGLRTSTAWPTSSRIFHKPILSCRGRKRSRRADVSRTRAFRSARNGIPNAHSTGVPLSGLFWRTESTYSRDDTCNAAGDTAGRQAPPCR